MPDNLRISAPINSEQTVSIKNNKPAVPIEVVDPTRVSSKIAENKTNSSNSEAGFDNNSVFQSFVTNLQNTQPLSQTLGKLILGSVVGDIHGEKVQASTDALTQLWQSVKMNDSDILQNILFQQKNNTVYNSSLFRLLNDITAGTDSDESKQYFGRFIKAYDSYMTASETMNSILHQAKSILAGIPKSYKAGIQKSAEMLQVPPDKDGGSEDKIFSDKEIQYNLYVLKEKLVPSLAKYVSELNDYGETRDKISLLVHSLSILNTGGKAELDKRFEELIDYLRYERNIPMNILKASKELYNQLLKEPLKQDNALFDNLIKALSKDSTGEISSMGQSMINDTMQSLLLDYSVYMPFIHMFLPVQYNGKFMFSDIWLEKDSDNNIKNENSKNLYLNFDIENLGSFQCIINYSGSGVKCNLFLPESFKTRCDSVKADITGILSETGFNNVNVKCESASFDIKKEILKRVGSGRDSVDVTV